MTIENLLESYQRGIEYTPFKHTEIQHLLLDGLEKQKGIVIETDAFAPGLSIHRQLAVFDFMNKQNVIESVSVFAVIDCFGVDLYEGKAEDIVEFVQDWFSENNMDIIL